MITLSDESSYLETYAQRLFDLRKGEFRVMTDEQLLCALGEALDVLAPSEAEIQAVATEVRNQLRDESLAMSFINVPVASDDGLYR